MPRPVAWPAGWSACGIQRRAKVGACSGRGPTAIRRAGIRTIHCGARDARRGRPQAGRTVNRPRCGPLSVGTWFHRRPHPPPIRLFKTAAQKQFSTTGCRHAAYIGEWGVDSSDAKRRGLLVKLYIRLRCIWSCPVLVERVGQLQHGVRGQHGPFLEQQQPVAGHRRVDDHRHAQQHPGGGHAGPEETDSIYFGASRDSAISALRLFVAFP